MENISFVEVLAPPLFLIGQTSKKDFIRNVYPPGEVLNQPHPIIRREIVNSSRIDGELEAPRKTGVNRCLSGQINGHVGLSREA
jgi:hypothetical protein